MKPLEFNDQALAELVQGIRQWAGELGFQQAGIAGIALPEAEGHLQAWLAKGFHGEMDYMKRHGIKRSRPAALLPGTLSIISVRMDYLPEPANVSRQVLDNPAAAYISRYALGRDYHKLMRNRLQKLAEKIQAAIGPYSYRAFVDSAPVLEKAIAEQAGLGWIGKHSNLINRQAGSWFFLGEIYTDLPLPIDKPASNHCGACDACLAICPSQAIVAPYQVDARRCVSYLTIELKGSIPVELRPLLGNRIYGCDDCQLVCPWNRFARLGDEGGFKPRHRLNTQQLLEVFAWDEDTFLSKTEGSAIRRIGYQAWLRNIAVALGNAQTSASVIAALTARDGQGTDLVNEHVQWALAQHIHTELRGDS